MSNSPMDLRPHQWSRERYPLTAHLARHPFIYASLLLHTVLLWIFSSIGVMQLEQQTLARNESLVKASMQKAAHGEMLRRVQDIQKIEALLKNSLAKTTRSEQPEPEDASQTPPTPEQIMRRAQELLASIQKIEDEIKIKEMARVLQIPEQQAAKKLQAERAADQPEVKKAATTLEQIEQEAREALVQRQRQLEQAGNGLPILGGVRNFVRQAQELVVHGAGGSDSAHKQAGDADGMHASSATHAQADDPGARAPSMALKPAVLRSGSANTFGSGGRYANRVAVNNWYIIGPFEGADQASIEKRYPPELAVDLDASYFGKYRRIVEWKYMHTNQHPMISTLRGEYAVYYGYAEISMDQERDLWVAMGAEGDAKVWLNDRVVWVSSKDEQAWHDTHFIDAKKELRNLKRIEGKRKLHLHKGKNTLMFKLYNGIDAGFFSLVLAADAGN